MNPTTQHEFIPNINVANDEIIRLENKVAELQAQLAAKNSSTPKAQASTAANEQPQIGDTKVVGLQRAINAATKK